MSSDVKSAKEIAKPRDKVSRGHTRIDWLMRRHILCGDSTLQPEMTMEVDPTTTRPERLWAIKSPSRL
jgi:hypothetical protein